MHHLLRPPAPRRPPPSSFPTSFSLLPAALSLPSPTRAHIRLCTPGTCVVSHYVRPRVGPPIYRLCIHALFLVHIQGESPNSATRNIFQTINLSSPRGLYTRDDSQDDRIPPRIVSPVTLHDSVAIAIEISILFRPGRGNLDDRLPIGVATRRRSRSGRVTLWWREMARKGHARGELYGLIRGTLWHERDTPCA